MDNLKFWHGIDKHLRTILITTLVNIREQVCTTDATLLAIAIRYNTDIKGQDVEYTITMSPRLCHTSEEVQQHLRNANGGFTYSVQDLRQEFYTCKNPIHYCNNIDRISGCTQCLKTGRPATAQGCADFNI